MNAHSVMLLLATLGALASCAPQPSPAPSFMKLPVIVDSRPAFVLFSWRGTDDSFRFALVHDQEQGVRRNEFLDRFTDRRTRPIGLDFAALEQALSRLPKTSVIEWWVAPTRHLTLPSRATVQRIRRVTAERHFDLRFTDADHAEA